MRALLFQSLLWSAGVLVVQGTPAPYAAERPLPEPVLFAPGQISTGDDESHPTFTADGRLFFFKNAPDFFTSNRTIDEPIDVRLDYRALLGRIRSSGNGLRDIYQVDYAALALQPPCGRAAGAR